MESVKIVTFQYGYTFEDASNDKMVILADFLLTDVSFHSSLSFKQFALNSWEEYTSSNVTALEKKDGYILLSDLYPEEPIPTIVKMTHDQYIKLLDDWEEKVCKLRPKEIIIKYENDEYIIETKN